MRNVEVEGKTYDVSIEEEYREALLEAIKRIIRSIENG